MSETPVPGLTVADVTRRLRVGEDRMRGWIRCGELAAVNRRDIRCARPCWVITPEAVTDFERGRQAATPNAPKPKRRRKASQIVFYPD